jgi:hypothetical protein
MSSKKSNYGLKKQVFGASQRSAHNMKKIHHRCGPYFHEIMRPFSMRNHKETLKQEKT